MPRAGLLSDDNRLRCIAERPLREIDIVADFSQKYMEIFHCREDLD